MWSLLACISSFKFSISSFAARNATTAYQSSNKSMSDINHKNMSTLLQIGYICFQNKHAHHSLITQKVKWECDSSRLTTNTKRWEQKNCVNHQMLGWWMGNRIFFSSSLCFLFWRELLCLWNTIKLRRLKSRRKRHSGTCHQVYPTIIDVNNTMNIPKCLYQWKYGKYRFHGNCDNINIDKWRRQGSTQYNSWKI